MVGKYVGEKAGSYVGDKAEDFIKEKLEETEEDDNEEENEEEETEKKSGGGGSCSSDSNNGGSAADYPPGTNPDTDLGEVGMDDVDDSVNQMCKNTYTVYEEEKKCFSCPIAKRDNVSDGTTPQDDLITLEKDVRDFLKLEGKIYDPETTNPRFFAPEGWVQHFEKDKNIVLALQDQYKANTIKMEHLYNVVDGNNYSKLKCIPNQDKKSTF